MVPAFPGVPACLLVDLSHYHADANLTAAAHAGIAGVLLKASQGAGWRDPAFAVLLARARTAGLLVGAYHFGTAADPAAQLDNFIGAVADAGGGFDQLVAILDLELNTADPAGTMHPDAAEAWLAGFGERTGCTPMIYAGAYLRERGGAQGRPHMAACPLWLAQYGHHAQTLPGWNDWTLWQFTDGRLGPYAGRVSGIGPCDQNIYRGTPENLMALWAKLMSTSGLAVHTLPDSVKVS